MTNLRLKEDEHLQNVYNSINDHLIDFIPYSH